jgi:chloramphenicol O-acetyltransferase type A
MLPPFDEPLSVLVDCVSYVNRVCTDGVVDTPHARYHEAMRSEGSYRIIDPNDWPRREQFELFKGFGFPYFNLTTDLDITSYSLARRAVSQPPSFTLGIVHGLASAANSVSAFRQRIRGGDVIEFEIVHPSIVLLNEHEAFRFCTLPFHKQFSHFLDGAPERMEAARSAESMFSVEDREDDLFLTSLPWVSFSGVTHAVPTQPPDTVPRIAWGKTRGVGEQVLLPLNVQVHHALVDGLHVARFFHRAEEIFASAEDWVTP